MRFGFAIGDTGIREHVQRIDLRIDHILAPLLAEASGSSSCVSWQSFWRGVSAYFRGNQQINERAFRRGVELEDGRAALNLGVLLRARPRRPRPPTAACQLRKCEP